MKFYNPDVFRQNKVYRFTRVQDEETVTTYTLKFYFSGENNDWEREYADFFGSMLANPSQRDTFRLKIAIDVAQEQSYEACARALNQMEMTFDTLELTPFKEALDTPIIEPSPLFIDALRRTVESTSSLRLLQANTIIPVQLYQCFNAHVNTIEHVHYIRDWPPMNQNELFSQSIIQNEHLMTVECVYWHFISFIQLVNAVAYSMARKGGARPLIFYARSPKDVQLSSDYVQSCTIFFALLTRLPMVTVHITSINEFVWPAPTRMMCGIAISAGRLVIERGIEKPVMW